MNFILIGYGKMGKAVESAAIKRGHRLITTIDSDNDREIKKHMFAEAHVAFEFTEPSQAVKNILLCFENNLPVVCGTTGWDKDYEMIRKKCISDNKSLFTASNFSIGVNIVMEINRRLASIMNKFGQYEVSVSETHHIHKLDAPSGTAITIANDIIKHLERKEKWMSGKSDLPELLGIESFREGEIAGIHSVIYESSSDIIELKHSSKNREGLAIGAVSAAEWLIGKKGAFNMYDFLGFGGKNDDNKNNK